METTSRCRSCNLHALAFLLCSPFAARVAAGLCPPRAEPPAAPAFATDLNGVAWPDYCFEARELEEHFFIIGDWGGIFHGKGVPPETAFDHKRTFVHQVDDRAQLLVAEQMKLRANVSKPRYLLNVGDNFYWGGVNTKCGETQTDQVNPSSLDQWLSVYENIYDGPDLLGKPWLGVLGNHDYGGYMFTKGWDQAIAYTWGDSDRWVTPAQYWSTKVVYSDFTVDYIFVDSNMNDAFPPEADPGHNMCSERNNPKVNASCGVTGPTSPWDCTHWFMELWEEQILWMETRLNASTADWKVVVTHFPPDYRREVWARLATQYGIDLIVTGHRHQQELSGRDPELGYAAWAVSGGGGGITSEGMPRVDGQDNQYGFMDVTISKSEMKIESISHSGVVRLSVVVDSWRTTSSTTSATSTTTATNATTSTTSTVSVSPSKYARDMPDHVGAASRPWSCGTLVQLILASIVALSATPMAAGLRC